MRTRNLCALTNIEVEQYLEHNDVIFTAIGWCATVFPSPASDPNSMILQKIVSRSLQVFQEPFTGSDSCIRPSDVLKSKRNQSAKCGE